MNPKNEISGLLSSTERLLQSALTATQEAWEEGEMMLNPREYAELSEKVKSCKSIIQKVQTEMAKFGGSVEARKV